MRRALIAVSLPFLFAAQVQADPNEGGVFGYGRSFLHWAGRMTVPHAHRGSGDDAKEKQSDLSNLSDLERLGRLSEGKSQKVKSSKSQGEGSPGKRRGEPLDGGVATAHPGSQRKDQAKGQNSKHNPADHSDLLPIGTDELSPYQHRVKRTGAVPAGPIEHTPPVLDSEHKQP